ncbi:MAG: hypothetical protein JNJ55_10115 [Betaproteobacteria bacterium]|nr:hypothetical protein [Betaproteobacteria bacterium]
MILRTAILSLTLLLAACATPNLKPRAPITDDLLNGRWEIKSAEMDGKDFKVPGFVLEIAGNKYRGGTGPELDTGSLVFYGDETADQARRMDVIGESGPNKGRKMMAIYRFVGPNGSELEACYDFSGKDRPAAFESKPGTMIFRVTYVRVK